jgi:hypothetical protein
MGPLLPAAKYGLPVLIVGFAAVVLWKMVSGAIPLRGLFKGPNGFSVVPLQLLVATILVAGQYVWCAAQHRPPSQGWLAVSALSSVVYLGGQVRNK